MSFSLNLLQLCIHRNSMNVKKRRNLVPILHMELINQFKEKPTQQQAFLFGNLKKKMKKSSRLLISFHHV